MSARSEVIARTLPLPTVDAKVLGGTLYRSDHARAGVLLLGAAATPHRYYRRFAAWLAAQGFTVLTFDYRGIGASRSPEFPRIGATMRQWGTHDVAAALGALQREVPDLPIVGVGHSFGGQALGLSDGLGELCGLLTVGTQLGWRGHWPQPWRAGMWMTSSVLLPGAAATLGWATTITSAA